MKILCNDYSGPAVYQIRNETNNKIYIGSTTNYSNRIKQHILLLESNKHDNKHMQTDYNSGDSFKAEILKRYPEIFKQKIFKHELFSWECDFIEKSIKEGNTIYNITPMKHNYYLDKQVLEKKLADISCKMIFGDTLERCLNNRPEAYAEMMYYLLDASTEQDKNNIYQKYKPLLDYQTKDKYYFYKYKIHYCDYLQLTEDQQREIKRALE
jgi:hypothetical protein